MLSCRARSARRTRTPLTRRPLPWAARRARHSRAGSPARSRGRHHPAPNRRGDGLGKTRLLDELQTRLRGVRVGRATCSLLERHLPYVPLATASAKHSLASSSMPPNGSSPSKILPELALGKPKPDFEEIEVLEALVTVVAEHGPVLVLDDLHWADPRTLAALGYLRRRGVGLPGAIVTTARPPAGPRPTRHTDWRRIYDSNCSLSARRPCLARDPGPPRLYRRRSAAGHRVPGKRTRTTPSETLTEALLAQCRAEGDWAYRVLPPLPSSSSPSRLNRLPIWSAPRRPTSSKSLSALRATHPPGRRIPLPFSLRPRPRGATREHLAGKATSPAAKTRSAGHRHLRGQLTPNAAGAPLHAHDGLSGFARTCLRDRPRTQLHPRRQRRRLLSPATPRRAPPDAHLQHPSG